MSKLRILDNREIVDTDKLSFRWSQDRKRYFLIRIENGHIHCGYVNNDRLGIEFIGKDPEKIYKEIARRKLCSLEHMGYLGMELCRAKKCLAEKKKYIQR